MMPELLKEALQTLAILGIMVFVFSLRVFGMVKDGEGKERFSIRELGESLGGCASRLLVLCLVLALLLGILFGFVRLIKWMWNS